jgi:succinate-acetate transporter protein
MIFLTAYRNLTLSALHVVITLTFLATTFARLDFISELLPGWGHIIVGLMAFYHAVGSLTQAFTGRSILPLGPPLLFHTQKHVHSIAKVV